MVKIVTKSPFQSNYKLEGNMLAPHTQQLNLLTTTRIIMIGSRLFKRKIRLTSEEISKYQYSIQELNKKAGRCYEILKTALEDRNVDTEDLGNLVFDLTPPYGEKKPRADVLKDDIEYFTRFCYANGLVSESAKKMDSFLGDTAWKLRDDSKLIEGDTKTHIVNSIKNILIKFDVDPPEVGKFPKLEQKLDSLTQDFLNEMHPHGDHTDRSDNTLMYLTRDFVIIREFTDMLHIFTRHLGRMRK